MINNIREIEYEEDYVTKRMTIISNIDLNKISDNGMTNFFDIDSLDFNNNTIYELLDCYKIAFHNKHGICLMENHNYPNENERTDGYYGYITDSTLDEKEAIEEINKYRKILRTIYYYQLRDNHECVRIQGKGK